MCGVFSLVCLCVARADGGQPLALSLAGKQTRVFRFDETGENV